MKPCKEATLTETAQGAFVLDTRTGTCFALNPVGVQVWLRLKEGKSADEIVTILECRYTGVERSKLAADVTGFIDRLASKNLLVP